MFLDLKCQVALHSYSSTGRGHHNILHPAPHPKKNRGKVTAVGASSAHTANIHRWDQPSVIRGSFVCYDEYDCHFYITFRPQGDPQEIFVDWIIMLLFNWRQCHGGHPRSLSLGKILGKEGTFWNCFCRSTWYLTLALQSHSGVDISQEKMRLSRLYSWISSVLT